MGNDELSATITSLEHALLDVWEWERLYSLGRLAHQVRDEWDRRPMRQMQQQISHCLVDSFTKALEIADNALQGMENSPAAYAALERLCQRLQLSTGEGSFIALLDQTDAGDLIDTSPQWKLRVGDVVGEDETGSDLKGNWSFVAAELEHYGGKVVDHVRGYLAAPASRTGDAATLKERIVWEGKGAELAYLFQSLHAKHWITLPTHNGKPNFTGMARVLFAAFEIRDGDEPMKWPSFNQACKVSGDNAERKDNRNWTFQIKPRQS